MSTLVLRIAGLLGLAGAVMVFAGSAAAGSLAAAAVTARSRLRDPRRLAVYVLGCATLVVAGVALTRREALAAVLAFAVVPFVVGFAMAAADLRRRTR
jgi:hypothetical protein